MADIMDEAEFWLPSHVLSGGDNRMDKENARNNGASAPLLGPNKLFFPPDFLYGFDSPAAGSVETESDEEDLFTELTRQLARSNITESQKLAASEKTWVLSGSPESTLSALWSWSGSPNGPSQKSSPPVTPPSSKRDPWDVLYAAAGQVARMKTAGEGPKEHSHHQHHHNRPLFGCSGDLSSLPVKKPTFHGHYCNQNLAHSASEANRLQNLIQGRAMKQENPSIWRGQAKEEQWCFQQNQLLQQQRIQNRGRCSVGHGNERCGPPLGLPQSAWPPLQHSSPPPPPQNHHGCGMRAVFLGGGGGESSGKKRESTGTGVFLPRRYGNPPESRKKQGCSTVLLPARVVQALNLNCEEMSSPAQRRFINNASPDYETLVARRNALLIEQQKRRLRQDMALNNELRLPQEWTY